VRLKGVRLHNPHDEDSELDPGITFSIQELWAPAHVEGAQRRGPVGGRTTCSVERAQIEA
jgi:hypothetical protein